MNNHPFSYSAHLNNASTKDAPAKGVLEVEFKNIINDMFDCFPGSYRHKSPEKWAQRLVEGKNELTIEMVKEAAERFVESGHLPKSLPEFRNKLRIPSSNTTDTGNAEDARAKKETNLYYKRRERFVEKYGKDKLAQLTQLYYFAVFVLSL